MKAQFMDFTGTSEALNLVVKGKREEGLLVKVKRVADLDNGERKYRFKLSPKRAIIGTVTGRSNT